MNVQADSAAGSTRFLLEKDVDVPMRDGARLKADVFRPKDGGKVPAILNLGPYQKDKLWTPPPNLEEKPNPYMNWEAVNPERWVPQGYAAVRVDARGSGQSPGQYEPWSRAESVDYYDAIEWAAAQPWCNGKVGLCGISYFAINQWFAANQQPPSLKAIIPWEGFADLYRDALFHGGILCLFMTNWFTAHLIHHLVGRASQIHPDAWQKNTLQFWLANNLDSGAFTPRAWRERKQRKARILEIFPPLVKLMKVPVGRLSGGERRMVCLGRGLMADASLFLVDEPSLGLAPKIGRSVMQALMGIELGGAAMVIAEQNVSLLEGRVDRIIGMHVGKLKGEASVSLFGAHTTR